ncbi:MAG TPA: mycofactocin biosynthesis glycosyltransferase MftF [Solirubrobacterales bacterium]|nr:mycofactocin biosynthesis glycosyltransferase MftF [Solirubrobacterales bacterium]
MSAAPRRFELDPSVHRWDGGRLLVGGTPPRLVRLSEAGAAALDAVLAGDPGGGEAEALVRRLERHGLLHPLPDPGAAEPEVTTVVPVLDGGEPLGRLVRTLAAEGPVIVVDDGSGDGSGARAAAAGARVIANTGRRGPAGARNTGLRAARTEIVAFLDADCTVAPGWRAGLAALLVADPELALIAPRVRSAPGGSALARYEERASPLDLGPHPSLVGTDRRIAYLPSAALLGRRDALLAVDGFDEFLRYGEDVDLVWRLLVAGRLARYAPAREVSHEPRPTPASMARQRAGYGGAAPDLALRHGDLAAPLTVGPHAAAVWAAVLALGPLALPPALATSLAVVAARGEDRDSRLALADVALRGHVTAARHLARALTREWLPLALLAAGPSRRARRLLLAAFLADTLPLCRRAPRDAPATAALRALDHAAYAAGLWRRSLRLRTTAALRPRVLSPSDPSRAGR